MTQRTVKIPSCEMHGGNPFYAVNVTLEWTCPQCGGERGPVKPAISYDGSRRLAVDGWQNACGHIDYYSDVRVEARTNGLNPHFAPSSHNNALSDERIGA